MADYMPRADAAFDTWQANFITYASANTAALGLAAGDITPLTTAQTAWNTDYPAHVAAQAAASSAKEAKDASRTALEDAIRALVARLQASADVSDEERAGLGITVPDSEPTPVGVPETVPEIAVDVTARLEHTVKFTDELTPTSTAKPAGVVGCELWVKIGGEPPADPAECTFLALDTRTPYRAVYAGADANKVAHYMARWVNRRAEKGPWSATASATIGA